MATVWTNHIRYQNIHHSNSTPTQIELGSFHGGKANPSFLRFHEYPLSEMLHQTNRTQMDIPLHSEIVESVLLASMGKSQ